MTITESIDEEGGGTVTSDFDEGDLFLLDEYGASYRLSWTGLESEEERVRSVPAGTYRLRTYRIVRREGDALWHISVTAPTLQTIDVRPGENIKVEVGADIHLGKKLGGERAQMRISDAEGAGLSIYREGKRIPIDYRILGSGGEQLASGRMRYG